jgi:photosystem II stability/assembly factor-like uncharacterized protein
MHTSSDATFPATKRRSRPGAVPTACLAFLLASARIAAALPWVSHGPLGGTGTAIAIDPTDPTTMYAGTNGGGFFKSTDGGATWSAINEGVANVGGWNVTAIAVDPATPTRVHGAVSSGGLAGGVFTTTDGGASWTLRSFAFLNDLAIDPLNPTTLWGAGGGLYKSTDAGATWSQVRSSEIVYLSVTVDPSSPSTVYAGTIFGAVDKTTDGGANWTTLGPPVSDHVEALAVHPTTSAIVYAGLQDFGVYKSIDGGMSWTALGPTVGGQKFSVEDLAIDPANPAIVYAAGFLSGIAPSIGVYKSTDGGASWNETPLVAFVRAIALDAANPSILIAGTQDEIGLWKTTDGGGAWSIANDGLVNSNVGALATAPSAPGVVYAATGGQGVLRSDDGGVTWDPTAFTDFLGQFIALAVDPTSEDTVYLAAELNGVHKTSDGGATWSPINSGTLPILVDSLAIDPTNPQIVYAGGFGGVARSTVGGGNWTLVNNGLFPVITALAIDPTAPGTLYAGTDPLMGPFMGVFKTTNSGGSWSSVNTGLPAAPTVAVQALAIDPAAPATVYAALERGVYKTTDGGTSWSAVNTGLEIPDEALVDVRSLAVDPVLPDTVYAGTAGWGVFVTSNGGASWAPINLGLYNPFVRAVAAAPGRLYAGTAANGAFVNTFSTAPAETILGKSFVVQNPSESNPAKRRITMVASESGSSLTFDVDALLAHGATLTVSAEGEQLLSQSFVLPATAWKRTGTGARYADRKGAHGAVANVVLTRSSSGTVKLSAKILGKLGGGLSVVPPDPGTAGGVRLDVNGGPTYCVAFGGAAGGVVVNQGAALFRVVNPTADGCP